MSRTLKISLKANEKIYVNGAVLRADRKVTLEFLNEVDFLLQSHVLQANQADTPLKQLYFIVQMILINPEGAEQARVMFRTALLRLLACFEDESMLCRLKDIDQMVIEGRVYDALKTIRGLFERERKIMENQDTGEEQTFAVAVGE